MGSETKALVKTGQPMPIATIEELGKLGAWLAKSGMFGCTNEHQGVVLALACHTTGMNPIELKENYHLIDGNLSKRADAMLAALREHGGEYEITSRTADKAEIKIVCGKAKGSFTLSWDEAQQEPFVWGKPNKAGERKLKKNWATPRARMQMLWARVVSDGVRACCPEAVKGSYAPEELQDMRESTPGGAIEIPPEEVESSKPEAAKAPPVTSAEQSVRDAKKSDVPKSEPEPAVDYTKVPMGRKSGTHFKELTIDQLKAVVDADPKKYPAVTEKHKKNAANWLKKKEAKAAEEAKPVDDKPSE